MTVIYFAAVFGFVWGIVAHQVLARRRLRRRPLRAAVAYLAIVSTLAVLNFELGVFDQKVAAEYAFTIYQRGEAERLTSTFLVQAAVNAIPFAVTGAWWASIGTNVAAMAVVYGYVRDRARSVARLLWAPAIVNFAMFSLRDPLIGVALLYLTLCLCRPSAPSRTRLGELGVAFVTYLARPELITVYLAGRLAVVRRWIGRRTWLYALLPLVALAVLLAVLQIPRLLGLPGQVGLRQLPATLTDFFTTRAARNLTGDNAGSNILGGAIIDLPLPVRFPVQLLCFFVLPLPFEVRSLPMLLAMVDSIVFTGATLRFVKVAPPAARRFFALYVLAVAAFAANYGNLFRLRMPAYFIIVGGLVAAQQPRRAVRPSLATV